MKKNTLIPFLLCGACVFFLVACPIKVPDLSEKRIRSYVVAFGEATSFGMELTDRNNILLYWTPYWRPDLTPGQTPTRWVSFQSRGVERQRYDALATQYGDLSYYRITRFNGLPPRMYVSNRIVSIDVRSDMDFNAEYPAGASLAGFVRLLSVSPIRFIESGYRETFDWHRNYPVDFLRETATFHQFIPGDLTSNNRWIPLYPNHFPISGMLSELEQDDFRLLGIGREFLPSMRWAGWFFGFLVFDKEPENLGTHNLTVTIYRTCGQMLSQTIEKTF